MEAALINPFLQISIQAFKQMFGIEANNGSPYVMEPTINHRWDLSAVVGLSGDVRGILALRMHERFVDSLLDKSGIAWDSPAERKELARSLAGEVLNVIGGNAAGKIKDINIDLTPPAVVVGPNHKIPWPIKNAIICIPFRTHIGDFEVVMCMARDFNLASA